MKEIKILDCTLRDGGYYTLWDFDKVVVEGYCNYISKLPIEYIEIGYKSIPKNEYLGEYYYTPQKTISKIKSMLSENQKISIMLNAKDCINNDVKKLLCDSAQDISLIRIAIDPKNINTVFKLVNEIKNFNIDVALNLMYLSEDTLDHKLIKDLKKFNDIVSMIYLVDSYGSLYPEEIKSLIETFNKNGFYNLGFHGHNNLELAFINTLEAIESGIKIIDATVLGMGRGAGNLKLELILTYLKSKKNTNIDLQAISNLYDLFLDLYNEYKWGTNLPYMISGAYSLPQKDVMEAIEINRYSAASLINSMSLKEKRKLKELKNNSTEIDNVIILGGGLSVIKHFEAIYEYLHKNRDIVIIHSSSKYINEFNKLKNLQYFCVTGNEVSKLRLTINNNSISKYIFGPSPRKIEPEIINDNFFELSSIDFLDIFHDSPLTISLQLSLNLKTKNITFIGFDGYQLTNTKKEFLIMKENQEIISRFNRKIMPLTSLTKTNYKNLKVTSIYSKLDQ